MPYVDRDCELCGEFVRGNNYHRHKARNHGGRLDDDSVSVSEDSDVTSVRTDSPQRRIKTRPSKDTDVAFVRTSSPQRRVKTKPKKSAVVSNDYVRDAVLCMMRRTTGINQPALSSYLATYFPEIPAEWRAPIIVATFSAAQKAAATYAEAMMGTEDDRTVAAKRSMGRWVHGLSAIEPGHPKESDSGRESAVSSEVDVYSPSTNFLVNRPAHAPLHSRIGRRQLDKEMTHLYPEAASDPSQSEIGVLSTVALDVMSSMPFLDTATPKSADGVLNGHLPSSGIVEIVRDNGQQKSTSNADDPPVANVKTCGQQSPGSTDVVTNSNSGTSEQQSTSFDIINPANPVDEVNGEVPVPTERQESTVGAPLPEQRGPSSGAASPVAVNEVQEETVASDGRQEPGPRVSSSHQPGTSDGAVEPATFGGDTGSRVDTDVPASVGRRGPDPEMSFGESVVGVICGEAEMEDAQQRSALEVPSSDHQASLTSQTDTEMTTSDGLNLVAYTFDELFMTMNFEIDYEKSLTTPLPSVLSPLCTPAHNNVEPHTGESILRLHASPSPIIEGTGPPSRIEETHAPPIDERTKSTSRTDKTEHSSNTTKKSRSPVRAPAKSTDNRHYKSPNKRSSSSTDITPKTSTSKENSKRTSDGGDVSARKKAKESHQEPSVINKSRNADRERFKIPLKPVQEKVYHTSHTREFSGYSSTSDRRWSYQDRSAGRRHEESASHHQLTERQRQWLARMPTAWRH